MYALCQRLNNPGAKNLWMIGVNRLQSLDDGARLPWMKKDFRAHRIVVEVDDRLLAAVDDAAAARSTNVRRVTRTDVMRELIALHLAGDRARKASVSR